MNDTYTPAYGRPKKLHLGYLCRLFGAGFAIAACITVMIMLTVMFENFIILYIAPALMIAGVVARIIITEKICSFSADENEVVFKAVFRTCRFAYSDIKKLEVSREVMTREKGR